MQTESKMCSKMRVSNFSTSAVVLHEHSLDMELVMSEISRNKFLISQTEVSEVESTCRTGNFRST